MQNLTSVLLGAFVEEENENNNERKDK